MEKLIKPGRGGRREGAGRPRVNSHSYTLKLTKEANALLDATAIQLGISRSEVVERLLIENCTAIIDQQ